MAIAAMVDKTVIAYVVCLAHGNHLAGAFRRAGIHNPDDVSLGRFLAPYRGFLHRVSLAFDIEPVAFRYVRHPVRSYERPHGRTGLFVNQNNSLARPELKSGREAHHRNRQEDAISLLLHDGRSAT